MHQLKGFGLAIVLLSCGLLTGTAFAQVIPPAQHSSQARPFINTPVKHTLQGTYFSSGNTPTSIPAGYTTYDTESVKCVPTSGCTIEVDSMAELYETGSTTNSWALCAYVDGIGMTPGCYFDGVATKGTGDIATNINTLHVATGAHTVTVQVYTSDATSSLAMFQNVIKVYKP